jgi:hypothetical protein
MNKKNYNILFLSAILLVMAAMPMQAPPSPVAHDVSSINGNYDTGGLANSGIISSPPVTLQSYQPILTYFDWYEVEEDEPEHYDLRYVVIEPANGADCPAGLDGGPGREILELSNDPTSRGWTYNSIDMSQLGFIMGDQVIVSFVFDTRDGAYNNYKGWLIDYVRIDTVLFTFDDGLEGWQAANIGDIFVHTPPTADGDVRSSGDRCSLVGASLDGQIDLNESYYQGTSLWHRIVLDNGLLWYGHELNLWSPISLKPLVDTQLGKAQAIWDCISESLPEALSGDEVQSIELISTYMGNASSISNAVYASGQLAKAAAAMEQLMDHLGIQCP